MAGLGTDAFGLQTIGNRGLVVVKYSIMLAAIVALLAVPAAGSLPPVVSVGTAVVDGQYGEWNLAADYFADMYRAGNATKPVESRLYLRYNCRTNIMYALVLVVPGGVGYIDSAATTAWIAINAQNTKVVNELAGADGTPPDFAWVGRGFDGNPWHVRGYEASFYLAPGTHIIIAHIDVWSVSSQTSATMGEPGTGPTIVVPGSPSAVEPSTFGLIKALYR